jgi:hypothetical protein
MDTETLTVDGPTVVSPPVLPAELAQLAPGPRLSAVLGSIDPRRLTAHQLAIVIAAQSRQIAHEQSRLLVAVHELDHAPPRVRDAVVRSEDPVPYAMVEAAQAGRWTQQHATSTRDLALFVLQQVPALGRALASGQVDLEKAKVFQRLLANVVDVQLMRTIVALALPTAIHGTTGTLRAKLYRLRCRLSPDSVRRQRERDHDSRYLAAHKEISGLVTLVARFCDEQAAAAALEHVNAIAAATRTAGDPLRRSMDQLRTDIAVNLLAGVDPANAGFATPADRRGTITLHLNLATLAGLTGLRGLSARTGTCQHSSRPERALTTRAALTGVCPQCLAQLADLVLEPADLAGYGPLTAHVARQAAAQLAQVTTWRFALTDDDGQQIAEGPMPTDLLPEMQTELRRWAADTSAGPDGRARRAPTPAQSAFVRARDRHCQAPGCRVPAHRCQIDHRIPWRYGGPTLIDNLYSLCRLHHGAKDEAGHTYHPAPGGRMRWTTAAGHTYQDRPRPGRRNHHALGITVAIAAAYRHTPAEATAVNENGGADLTRGSRRPRGPVSR